MGLAGIGSGGDAIVLPLHSLKKCQQGDAE